MLQAIASQASPRPPVVDIESQELQQNQRQGGTVTYRSGTHKAVNLLGSAIATVISAGTLQNAMATGDHARIALGGAALATNFFDCIQKSKYIYNTTVAGMPEPAVRKGCPLSGGLAIAAGVWQMVKIGSGDVASTAALTVGSAVVAADALATTASQEKYRKETGILG